jgi:hypothetical protein
MMHEAFCDYIRELNLVVERKMEAMASLRDGLNELMRSIE